MEAPRPAAARWLGLALVALAACSRAPDLPPNLLLVTIDTLRADRLACYGGPPDVGPGICSLAERGTRFAWAFSAAPYTAPSVASILTSRYPAYHGVTQNASVYLDDSVETVTELLRRAGYTTAAFVSNPVLHRSRKLDQGFQVYDHRMTRTERNRPGYAEREAEATGEAALQWARVGAQPPWFLWVHFQDPHGPYEPPGARPAREGPGDPLPVLSGQSGRGGIPAYQALPGVFTPGAYERRYLDEIRYLDPHVTRLVEGLDALGERPAVLLTSDHGEAFGEDGYWFAHGHSVGFDQIRVPLLYRPAHEEAARVETAPTGLVDVAPTLLALAGLPIPEGFQGRPLPVSGVARAPDAERAIFSEHGRQAAVIAEGAYFARDRERVEGRVERELGDEMPALPARVARLPRDGSSPAYESAPDGAAGPLERALAEFLAGAERDRAPEMRRGGRVSEETRNRMRALGYVDD